MELLLCHDHFYALSGAIEYFRAHFGQGSGPIFIRSIGCLGNELRLLDCPRDTYSQHTCRHSEDASVHCEGTNEKVLRI